MRHAGILKIHKNPPVGFGMTQPIRALSWAQPLGRGSGDRAQVIQQRGFPRSPLADDGSILQGVGRKQVEKTLQYPFAAKELMWLHNGRTGNEGRFRPR